MKIVWANEPYPALFDTVDEVVEYHKTNSLFLAGPTPRSDEVQSWRPEALEILEDLGFHGSVFVPESKNGEWSHSYIKQVKWEEFGLRICGCIVFWIPRDLDTMPGFTTNIEWGRWGDSGRSVLGAPVDAPKMKYLRYYADKCEIPTADTLRGTLANALCVLEDYRELYYA